MPVAYDRIRLAKETDIPLLLPLMQKYNFAEGIAWSPEHCAAAVDHVLEHPNLGFVLVAEKYEPIGYAVVSYGFDLEFGGRDAFITEIYVHPGSRNLGVGTAFFNEIEKRAREQGIFALHLQVRPDNCNAYRLYERLGYQKVPRDTLSKTIGRPEPGSQLRNKDTR